MFTNILLLVIFITIPFSVIIFKNSLENGNGKIRYQIKYFKPIYLSIVEVVSNNWMSYMTNKMMDYQAKDVLTCSILILVTFTLIHSSEAYILIRIFLWGKHSKTIITAEKSLDLSILGFKNTRSICHIGHLWAPL